MEYIRGFWRRHRRKIFITAGCVGSGYLLYRLYNACTRRLLDLERQLQREREKEEIIKAQLKAHFEAIQMIADTTTMPQAIHNLHSRMAEELDVSNIMERLNKGKGILTPSEKLELWDRLKILTFTRMVIPLWAVTMLSLYIRVQVNILGRRLYIDTARGLGGSHILVDFDLIDRDGEQKFLESSDFLANYGVPALISNMQEAVAEVLKGKRLKDFFNTMILQETVQKILCVFMSTGSPNQWIDYLMPQDTRLSKNVNNNEAISSDGSKFDQLMVETREVLESTEFAHVVEISLKSVLGALVEHMETQSETRVLTAGMPLAKLIPRIELVIPTLTAEPSQNRFIQVIQNVPEVELFFTLLYAHTPTP